MNVKLTKIETNTVELEITVEATNFNEAIKKAYKKNIKSFNVPGFRKGKVPMNVVKQYYGTGVLLEDAIQFAVEETYPQALKEKLESSGIDGVSFRTIWYKPMAGSLKGELVKGLQFFFTDYEKARITEVQFHVMQALAQLYPDKKAFETANGIGLFDKVCGTDYVRKEFSKRYKVADIRNYWRKDEAAFREMSQKYHIY